MVNCIAKDITFHCLDQCFITPAASYNDLKLVLLEVFCCTDLQTFQCTTQKKMIKDTCSTIVFFYQRLLSSFLCSRRIFSSVSALSLSFPSVLFSKMAQLETHLFEGKRCLSVCFYFRKLYPVLMTLSYCLIRVLFWERIPLVIAKLCNKSPQIKTGCEISWYLGYGLT